METPRTQLWLVRHGETEWSRSGQHTSTTDLDLTDDGVRQAEVLRGRLDPGDFGLVLSSPRLRATHTAELAGFTDVEIDGDLAEWRYGDYEGRTSKEIREDVPDWRIWTHPVPNGETHDEVMDRLTRVVRRVQDSGVERALVFGHGHSLRVLALSWLHFDISRGQSFPLETATVSVLGFEKESPAIIRWNQRLGGDRD
ncbi:histidine phosphatase family protein [Mariniluteicoccus flavus]